MIFLCNHKIKAEIELTAWLTVWCKHWGSRVLLASRCLNVRASLLVSQGQHHTCSELPLFTNFQCLVLPESSRLALGKTELCSLESSDQKDYNYSNYAPLLGDPHIIFYVL